MYVITNWESKLLDDKINKQQVAKCMSLQYFALYYYYKFMTGLFGDRMRC